MNWGWGDVGQKNYDNNGRFLISNIAIQDPSAPDIKGDGNGSNFQYNRRYLTGSKPRQNYESINFNYLYSCDSFMQQGG